MPLLGCTPAASSGWGTVGLYRRSPGRRCLDGVVRSAGQSTLDGRYRGNGVLRDQRVGRNGDSPFGRSRPFVLRRAGRGVLARVRANGKSEVTVSDVLRHRSGLAHLKGVDKDEVMDHLLMEQKLAAAPLDRQHGKLAYHAVTYGWLLSGLARAVTGKGMRELFREELARPLNTDGIHLGRPPADSPTKAAQTLLPQAKVPTPLLDFIAPKVAGLSFSGLLGAVYFPGILSLLQDDMPFLDGEVPAVNGVVTARALAKTYGALANDGVIDGTRLLSSQAVRGLTGKSELWPDLNLGLPLPTTRVTNRLRCLGCWRVRPHRARWHDRMGRPGDRQRIRICA